MSGKARSDRWRERKRKGLISLTIDVSPTHCRALMRMGLIAATHDLDKVMIARAVERFLNTAPAIQAVGDALYPNVENDMQRDDESESQAVYGVT